MKNTLAVISYRLSGEVIVILSTRNTTISEEKPTMITIPAEPTEPIKIVNSVNHGGKGIETTQVINYIQIVYKRLKQGIYL